MVFNIGYDDLSYDMQQDIFLQVKQTKLKELEAEGFDELKKNGVLYKKWFKKCEDQIFTVDYWMVIIIQLYGFEVADSARFDRTEYLFHIEQFAEEKAQEYIDNKFPRLEVILP